MDRKILTVVVIFVIFLSWYIYFFQSTLIKGFSLYEEHCTKVNPSLVESKNKLIDLDNAIIASPDADQTFTVLDQYLQSEESYIIEEQQWLPKAKQFMDNTAFNIIMPGYMKNAAKYEYQMYYENYLSSAHLQQVFNESSEDKQIALTKEVSTEAKKKDDAANKYLSSWENDGKVQNWIFYFVTVPTSQCDAANTPNPFVPPMLPQLPIF